MRDEPPIYANLSQSHLVTFALILPLVGFVANRHRSARCLTRASALTNKIYNFLYQCTSLNNLLWRAPKRESSIPLSVCESNTRRDDKSRRSKRRNGMRLAEICVDWRFAHLSMPVSRKKLPQSPPCYTQTTTN